MIDDALKKLDPDTMAPPKSRVGNATAVRGRIMELRRADDTRASNRAKVQRWINGARPYDEGKLIELGQSDRTNFNPREAEGMADSAKTPFYALIFRNPRFASIETNYGAQPQRRAEWNESLSRSFHQLLEEWDEHDYNVQLYQWQMVVFGVGNTIWPDDKDWRWEPRKMGDVLVPNDCKSNIKQLPEAAIYRKYNPVDLWGLIEDEKSAKTMGWHPDRVKKAILNAAPDTMRDPMGFGNMWSEEYESSLRRGDVTWNSGSTQICVYDYLVKEFDGTITHCIILDDTVAATPDGKEDDGLLFKRQGRYECFDQTMCPFFFDIGTGEWHSVKGLGPKIFDNGMVSARLLCDVVDGARRGSGMILKAVDANAMEQTQLVSISGATVVQPGFEVVQNRIGTDLEGPLNARRELSNVLQSNTGQYRERVSLDSQENTLGQAQLNARNQMSLSESSADRYCKTLDRQYKEIVRRVINLGVPIFKRRHPNSETDLPEKKTKLDDGREAAYYFVRRCVEDGVPIEAIDMDYICSVKATRGVGSGSPVGMDMATQGLLQLLPMADPKGRREILRLRASFLVGQGNTDAVFPPFADADLPNDHAALATLENNALRTPNGEVLITPRQDHIIHFDTHYSDTSQDVQGLQQGQGNPMTTLIHLHQAGPHMKAHLNEIQGDPSMKQKFDERMKALDGLAKMADQLQQQVEESMKSQQAQQPKPDPAMVAAMVKTHGDLKIKGMKAQGDMALKAEKQKQMMRLKDLSEAHSMRLNTLKALPQPGDTVAA